MSCTFDPNTTCPNCNGQNIYHSHGSTNQIPIEGFEYLCGDCFYEW